MYLIWFILGVKNEDCYCGHARRQHSKNGCTWPGCGCIRKYMDW